MFLQRLTGLFLISCTCLTLSGCWFDMGTVNSNQANLATCALSLKGGDETGGNETFFNIGWFPLTSSSLSPIAQTFILGQDTTITAMTARLQNLSAASPTAGRVRMSITTETAGQPGSLIGQAIVPLASVLTGRYVDVPFAITATLQRNVRYWAIISVDDGGSGATQPINLKWLGSSASNSNPDLMIFSGTSTTGGTTTWTRSTTGSGVAQTLALGVGCGS